MSLDPTLPFNGGRWTWPAMLEFNSALPGVLPASLKTRVTDNFIISMWQGDREIQRG